MIRNSNIVINEIENPYPIWIIDDFLKTEILNDIKNNWPSLDSESWHKGHSMVNGKTNILEQGMRAISKLELMPDYLQDIFNHLYSQDFINYIEKITDSENLVHDQMNWSGLRCMLKDSFQLIHSDARKHPKANLKKELTCLFYLNDGYDKSRDEGCLEVWNNDMSHRAHEIEPLDNRLLIFRNSNTSYHGVPKVLSDRKAILFNYCSTDVEENARSKALFRGRPNDSEYVDELGLLRSKIQ